MSEIKTQTTPAGNCQLSCQSQTMKEATGVRNVPIDQTVVHIGPEHSALLGRCALDVESNIQPFLTA